MGRPRLHRKDLPKRMYLIDGIYYYFPKGAKPINLGRDEDAALRQYRKRPAARAAEDYGRHHGPLFGRGHSH